MKSLHFDAVADPDGAVAAAAAELLRGRPVVLPTAPGSGLALLPSFSEAVEDLFIRKGRNAVKSVAVLVSDTSQAAELTDHDLSEIDAFWPGPLTVVVRRASGSEIYLGMEADARGTVGVRCPNHKLVRSLAARVGPLATTSANRSGEPSPPAAAAAADTVGGDLLVLDEGICEGTPSTVIDLTESPAKILRAGALDTSVLSAAGLGVSLG